jgi:transcriptional regulator with GAF, ATPase, and Fis domain
MTKADDHPQEMPQEMEFVGYDRRFAPIHRASIDLHVQIAVLAREMQGENRPHYEPVAEEFVRLAPTYIDNVAHAGALLFVGRAGWRSVSQPGTTGFGFEQLHMDLEEGPAIDAADGRQVVRVTDLTVETRWPRFRDAAASKTAVRSMICYPLYTRIHTWGALMLFADQPAVLDGDSQQSGEILATHMALTLEAVHHDRHYRSALGSRDIIGQAKGMLIERFDVAVAAFALLTRLAEESHRPVVVVARELLETKSPNTL